MRYFIIMRGLRGGYMPDSVFDFKAETRREVKRQIESEKESIGEAFGLGKADLASFANQIWKGQARGNLPLCLPYNERRGEWKASGIMVQEISREEFRQRQKESCDE